MRTVFVHRIALLALVFLLQPGVVSRACGVTVELDMAHEGSDGEAGREYRTRETLVAGISTAVTVRTLYAIYVTIPITECFVLSCDIRIQGQPWDNDLLLPLQPMSKLVWSLHRADDTLVTAEDLARVEPLGQDADPMSFAKTGVCRFVASGIFRASEPGSYEIVVTYRDESLAAPLVYTLSFSASEPAVRLAPP